MYLSSKYEDIFPLHSKIVSDKIAHKAISARDILKREQEFLHLFDYQLDFVTHFDFHQTYADKIGRQIKGNSDKMKLVTDMAMVLVKMSMQNIDFCKYSASIVTLSSFYAATAFLKHSKKYESPENSSFCAEARKIIFKIIQEEVSDQTQFMSLGNFCKALDSRFKTNNRSKSPVKNQCMNMMQVYQKQFT